MKNKEGTHILDAPWWEQYVKPIGVEMKKNEKERVHAAVNAVRLLLKARCETTHERSEINKNVGSMDRAQSYICGSWLTSA